MSDRSKAFAGYLQDIYTQLDSATARLNEGKPLRLSISHADSASSNTDAKRELLSELKAHNEAADRMRDYLHFLLEQAGLVIEDEDEAAEDAQDDCAGLDATETTGLITQVAIRQWEAQLLSLADEYTRVREHKRRAEAAGADKDALDTLNELSEMEQLRLQMALDRLSKMISTLSNLLKRLSDTQAAITQNLK